MLYPISLHQVYCYAQIADKGGKYLLQMPISALNTLFKKYESRVKKCLLQLDSQDIDIITGRLESVISREVYHDRVLLIGDALHGCPPSLQQGVAGALEDAIVVSELLLEHQSVDAVLDAFKSQRLPQIDWVINESNKVIKLANIGKYFVGRLIRNRIIRKSDPANVIAWRKLLSLDGQTIINTSPS